MENSTFDMDVEVIVFEYHQTYRLISSLHINFIVLPLSVFVLLAPPKKKLVENINLLEMCKDEQGRGEKDERGERAEEENADHSQANVRVTSLLGILLCAILIY